MLRTKGTGSGDRKCGGRVEMTNAVAREDLTETMTFNKDPVGVGELAMGTSMERGFPTEGIASVVPLMWDNG